MVTELRSRNQAQNLYVRALSSAYRSNVQVYEPSLWMIQEPEIEEKMYRDADIQHALGFRQALVAGRQWSLVAKTAKSDRGKLAVAIGTELMEPLKKFTEARRLLTRAHFSGSRFARIHGELRTMTIGDGKPRKWWVPTRLQDEDKRYYRIQADHNTRGDLTGAHWQRWDLNADDWRNQTRTEAMRTIRHVYNDDQGTLGYGRALREALAWWWYAKTEVFQESLSAVERFAQGIIHARIDGVRAAGTNKPNTELIRLWKNVLTDLRSRHVLVSDINDQVEVIEGSGTGWQILSEMRAELRSSIFTLVLGANLNTSDGDGTGSYAMARTHENSTEALVAFDREVLEETLTDDLVSCLWVMNWPNLVALGVANEMPRFQIAQDRKLDPSQRAQIALNLLQAGVDLSAEDLYEQTGFKKPEEGEDVIEGQAQQEGGGGMGGFPNLAGAVDGQGGGQQFRAARDTAFEGGERMQQTPSEPPVLSGEHMRAAAEVLERVSSGTLPGETARQMLTSFYRIPGDEALNMVGAAEDFAKFDAGRREFDANMEQSRGQPGNAGQFGPGGGSDGGDESKDDEKPDDEKPDDEKPDDSEGVPDTLPADAGMEGNPGLEPLPDDGLTEEERADQEFSKLSPDVRDYLEGRGELTADPNPSPEDQAEADKAVASLGAALSAVGSAGAVAGTKAFALAGFVGSTTVSTVGDTVKIITSPTRMLRAAVGAGLLTAATLERAVRIYAGVIATVKNFSVKTFEKVQGKMQEKLGQGAELMESAAAKTTEAVEQVAEKTSLGDKVKSAAKGAWEGAKSGAKNVGEGLKKNPIQTLVSAGLIAIPFPGSADAGMSIKSGFKAWNAFDPLDKSKGLAQSVREGWAARNA